MHEEQLLQTLQYITLHLVLQWSELSYAGAVTWPAEDKNSKARVWW